MRSPQDDIAVVRAAGIWQDDRDPVLMALILLLMHAKVRHKPLVNLHRLADAVESGDAAKASKHYDRLVEEVERNLTKYPDMATVPTMMSEMSDDDLAEIDRLMK